MELDELDVVDSRTGSRPTSFASTLETLAVRFLVTGGLRGLELNPRNIAAGPGDCEEAEVGVDE